MTNVFYDTEFIDDGKTIELISIGMVADNGEEFYRINSDLSLDRLGDIPWHIENTVPSLPIGTTSDEKIDWLPSHQDFDLLRSKAVIRDEVANFLITKCNALTEPVDLWAWYGAYDHVALAQLWGPMIDLPGFVPMYTNDFKQELTRVERTTGNYRLHYILPKMHDIGIDGKAHNALDDARLLKARFEWLRAMNR